ncbi:zinc finger, CCHC-type containing protein, partial [Tanacetum coccineum]
KAGEHGEKVYGFGSGKHGQLGISNEKVKFINLPQSVCGLNEVNVSSIIANEDHSAALSDSSTTRSLRHETLLMHKSVTLLQPNKSRTSNEGNAYFGEALVVVGNDEMIELVMDSGKFKVVDGGSVQLCDNRTCTIKGRGKVNIQLHDGSSFILEDVRYVPGLRRGLISLGNLEKEGYIVTMQMGRIKVVKGCRVMMTAIRKKNLMTSNI